MWLKWFTNKNSRTYKYAKITFNTNWSVKLNLLSNNIIIKSISIKSNTIANKYSKNKINAFSRRVNIVGRFLIKNRETQLEIWNFLVLLTYIFII